MSTYTVTVTNSAGGHTTKTVTNVSNQKEALLKFMEIKAILVDDDVSILATDSVV